MQPGIGAKGTHRLTYSDIDTRFVLRVYAWVTIVAGASISGTHIRGIPGMPPAVASLIWMAGMVAVAAGCAAWGLALNVNPAGRRRALSTFAIGHLLLGLFVWLQWAIYWGQQGLPLALALAPLAAGITLLGIAEVAVRHPAAGGAGATALPAPGSTYDEHIRQVARREERARLARDLHDAVKQQLFVIQTAAATAQARFEDDPAGARAALAHVRTAAREATTEMEALLEELQAAPIENTGLIEALKKQCEALAFRTGADVSFEPGALPPEGSLQPGAHEAIYRVAQEALANVGRHARASRVTVSVVARAAQFELRVSDNGAGFDASAVRHGMGRANMEARAAEIGGRLTIVSQSSGTHVVLSVPLVDAGVRVAWRSVAQFGLVVLGLAVFTGIRGQGPDGPEVLIVVLLGAWVLWGLIAAYRRSWRQGSR
jgi:signal transduction histidine kinase